MSERAKRGPRIAAMDSDYEPGYPRSLTAEEYRALIAPDGGRRLLAAAAAAGFGLASCLHAEGAMQDEGTQRGARERRVLEVLRSLSGEHGGWFSTSEIQDKEMPTGTAKVPRIPISFGNSQMGVFDDARARQLATRMFEAYGLAPASGAVIESDGIEATIDGLDVARKVGFELRGAQSSVVPPFGRINAESEGEWLDDVEARTCSSRGIELHVADVADYPLMDGDQFTPTLAYLAGIVEFLNEATAGPDIDLSAVLAAERQRFLLPESAFEAGTGVSAIVHEEGAAQMQVTEGAQLGFELPGLGSVEHSAGALPMSRGRREWSRLEQPRSTAGRVSMLWIDTHSRGLRVSVAQGAGENRVDVTSAGSFVFLPPGFDAAQPFRLTIQSTRAGELYLRRHITIGLAPR